MSFKDKVTEEQWKALINAPSAAASYVATASGGGLEVIKEVFTAVKFVQESMTKAGGSGYGSLVDELLAAMKGMTAADARQDAAKFESRDVASIRAEAKQLVASGSAAADTQPEAEGYKRWLLDLARKVAETKTGGVLGFGGTSVIDEKEQAALDELKSLMGLP